MKEFNERDEIDGKAFIVPASDGQGHNVRVQVRLQPGHVQQISTILRTKAFPYRTQGDFLRHAVLHLLNYLEPLLPEGVNSVTKQVDVIIDTQRDILFNLDFGNVFDALAKSVQMHQERGLTYKVSQTLLAAINSIKAIPDEDWRIYYLEEMERRFGYLLGSIPNVSLVVKRIKFDYEEEA